jgi:hypothetical protein
MRTARPVPPELPEPPCKRCSVSKSVMTAAAVEGLRQNTYLYECVENELRSWQARKQKEILRASDAPLAFICPSTSRPHYSNMPDSSHLPLSTTPDTSAVLSSKCAPTGSWSEMSGYFMLFNGQQPNNREDGTRYPEPLHTRSSRTSKVSPTRIRILTVSAAFHCSRILCVCT